jgi:hypothetical protein
LIHSEREQFEDKTLEESNAFGRAKPYLIDMTKRVETVHLSAWVLPHLELRLVVTMGRWNGPWMALVADRLADV